MDLYVSSSLNLFNINFKLVTMNSIGSALNGSALIEAWDFDVVLGKYNRSSYRASSSLSNEDKLTFVKFKH
jgi:hypothetical protein